MPFHDLEFILHTHRPRAKWLLMKLINTLLSAIAIFYCMLMKLVIIIAIVIQITVLLYNIAL